MSCWIKLHSSLTKKKHRGVPRAIRFVFLELCLEAREGKGVIDLPLGMELLDGVHDMLGGNRAEVEAALAHFAGGDDPSIFVEGKAGALQLRIPSWEAWNAIDSSAERTKRYRESLKAAHRPASQPPSSAPSSDHQERPVTRSRHGDVSPARDGDALEEIREEKIRGEEIETRARPPSAPVQAQNPEPEAPEPAVRVRHPDVEDFITTTTRLAPTNSFAMKMLVQVVNAGKTPTKGQRASIREIAQREAQASGPLQALSESAKHAEKAWLEARRRKKLPAGPPDGRLIEQLAAKAARAAEEAPGLAPEAIVAHWIAEYLAQTQTRPGGVADHAYPLAWLVRDAGEKFGLPRVRRAKPIDEERPPDTSRSAEQTRTPAPPTSGARVVPIDRPRETSGPPPGALEAFQEAARKAAENLGPRRRPLPLPSTGSDDR